MKNEAVLNLKEKFRSWMILIILIVTFVFFGVTQESFLAFNSVHSSLYNASVDAIACVGFTLLLIMGEIDMSIGSMACLGGALMSALVLKFHLPLIVVIPIVFLLGGTIGYLTGLLITKFRLNAMMVTIGTMMAIRSIAWVFVNMFNGRQLPTYAKNFVKEKAFEKVYWIIIIVVILTVIMDGLLKKSKPFRQMYYIGHNMDTCNLYGIPVNKVKRIAFAFSGSMSAVCGVVKTARFAHAATDTGYNLEIFVITAAVLGGASIFGGKGSVLRTFFGLIFLYIFQNGLTAFAVNSYVQQIIIGLILIVAIILDIIMNKGSRKG